MFRFPLLARLSRDRPTDLKSTYYRFHVVIASFAYICSGVLMTSGVSLVHLLYDRRYEQAGWMLEILAVALLTVPFRLATQSFLALGRPHLLINRNCNSVGYPLDRHARRVLLLWNCWRVVGHRSKSLLICASDYPVQCAT